MSSTSTSLKFLLRTSLIFITLGFYACQKDSEPCQPGYAVACVDDNGCSGERVCNANGTAFSACMCDSSTTATTTEPTTTSTTDTSGTTTENVGGGGQGGSDNLGGQSSTDETNGDVDHGNVIFSGVGTSVSTSDNEFGIEGDFYVRQDSYRDGEPKDDELTHSEVTPVEFDASHDKPCINGQIAQVSGGQWSEVWGVLLGLQLAGSNGSWDATEHGIEGFEFELSGSVGDARLRFEAKVKDSDETFCAMLEHEQGETGTFSVALEDIEHRCYEDGGSMSFDPSQLEAVEWLAMADDGSSSPVEDFCVESLSVF